VANSHATLWSSPFIPKFENIGIECSYSRGLLFWIPCWRMGYDLEIHFAPIFTACKKLYFVFLGKPPVDEAGKPLYGDVFGMSDGAFTHQVCDWTF